MNTYKHMLAFFGWAFLLIACGDSQVKQTVVVSSSPQKRSTPAKVVVVMSIDRKDGPELVRLRRAAQWIKGKIQKDCFEKYGLFAMLVSPETEVWDAMSTEGQFATAKQMRQNHSLIAAETGADLLVRIWNSHAPSANPRRILAVNLKNKEGRPVREYYVPENNDKKGIESYPRVDTHLYWTEEQEKNQDVAYLCQTLNAGLSALPTMALAREPEEEDDLALPRGVAAVPAPAVVEPVPVVSKKMQIRAALVLGLPPGAKGALAKKGRLPLPWRLESFADLLQKRWKTEDPTAAVDAEAWQKAAKDLRIQNRKKMTTKGKKVEPLAWGDILKIVGVPYIVGLSVEETKEVSSVPSAPSKKKAKPAKKIYHLVVTVYDENLNVKNVVRSPLSLYPGAFALGDLPLNGLFSFPQ